MTKAKLILTAAMACAAALPARSGELQIFKAPILVRAIGFQARYEGGRVITAWRKYKRADFLAYKLVRSSTMRDPVFPENGELFSSFKSYVTKYDDAKVDDGVWYYRLCVITKGNNRWVSPVIEVVVNHGTGVESIPTPQDFE
jgi:hypothetical protein